MIKDNTIIIKIIYMYIKGCRQYVKKYYNFKYIHKLAFYLEAGSS